MRRLAFSCLIMLALGGCGGSAAEERAAAADANLLDEDTVNSLLGADIPPEAYPGATPAAENELNAAANSDAATADNRADEAGAER